MLASAVRVRAPRNITSSVGDGAEGRAVRAANRAHQELQEERQPLEKDSWVFYKAKYDCCEDKSCGGCHIPFLLGQLVGDLSELDTTDPDTRVEVKCWEPKEQCYDGDWRKWMDQRRQLTESIEVALIAMTKVYFTTDREKAGGLRQVSAAIKTQLKNHPQSGYAEFGARPAAVSRGRGAAGAAAAAAAAPAPAPAAGAPSPQSPVQRTAS